MTITKTKQEIHKKTAKIKALEIQHSFFLKKEKTMTTRSNDDDG